MHVLGHVAGSRAGIVGVYQRHQFEAEKRAALEAWATEVERIASGGRVTAPVEQSVGRIHSATATFAGSGSLEQTVGRIQLAAVAWKGSGSLTAAAVNPIDTRWLKALEQADKARSLGPLVAYLQLPGAQLGPAECYWLQELLGGLQFKGKTPGRPVPFRQQSRKQIHEACAAHVRHLQKTEGLSHADAIDRVVRTYPQWYEHDEGLSLVNFMKRGAKT